jgi:hypothetical protein
MGLGRRQSVRDGWRLDAQRAVNVSRLRYFGNRSGCRDSCSNVDPNASGTSASDLRRIKRRLCQSAFEILLIPISIAIPFAANPDTRIHRWEERFWLCRHNRKKAGLTINFFPSSRTPIFPTLYRM